ncbi:RUN and FYVE domain-containing protein 4 isoform X2 [Trichechus manatus latirostris]|uniref:RUN and FYVE domain-containing protein 4 n=1 Tax=Trichechus manatus latirostris TaxID=127582 RepID=A0A2Y9DKI1_TRIMA|nr:RUN and FYVE domain-containing protein 4 isoform X2 [Trichechus manatus latirostris]
MPMMEESAGLKVTRDLKAAVSAILQGYGDGQQSVTDASAELHRLCGCLELLLQFDQKEKKSFLRPRKDYWDFLSTALWQQRGDMEPSRFVRSQEKLKTPLGKGRAFIRFCLAHGQLAESLQLCLLNPELTREWYGPRSPLVCRELQEDILDSLYSLNGVAFDLDLQRPDLDGAWPMFSESRCSNSRKTQGRRPRRDKVSPKKISAACGGPKGVHQEEPHPNQASCLGDVPRGDCFAGLSGSQPHKHLPPFLEKKREDPRSPKAPRSRWEPEEELQQDQSEGAPRPGICLQNSTPSIQGQREGSKGAPKEVIGTEAEGRGGLPGAETQRSVEETHEGEAEWGHVQRLLTSSPRRTIEEVTWGRRQESEVPSIPGEHWVLQGLEKGEDSTTEKPQKRTGATSVAGREAQAEASLQDVVKSLRHQLRKAKEQGQHQKQLLMEQDRELKALQKQLSRCQEESAQLQAELARKQQEAERRDAMYQEELGGQRDLVQAMKRRVLELIQEKDNLWQKVQHLSSVAPECCVSCSKIFGRLSRRYPCRLCGGLVCHACSTDYNKRERCCPLCSRREDSQVT